MGEDRSKGLSPEDLISRVFQAAFNDELEKLANKRWWILRQSGKRIMQRRELPPRPADAARSHDPFRPWNKGTPHVHASDGLMEGIHDYGSLRVVRNRARKARIAAKDGRLGDLQDDVPLPFRKG